MPLARCDGLACQRSIDNAPTGNCFMIKLYVSLKHYLGQPIRSVSPAQDQRIIFDGIR